ncbi:hypothetical protein D3C85_1483220 [compost metagenome]
MNDHEGGHPRRQHFFHAQRRAFELGRAFTLVLQHDLETLAGRDFKHRGGEMTVAQDQFISGQRRRCQRGSGPDQDQPGQTPVDAGKALAASVSGQWPSHQ